MRWRGVNNCISAYSQNRFIYPLSAACLAKKTQVGSGRDKEIQLMQETFNRRHPVSVTFRRIQTLLGHSHLHVQRTHSSRESTHQAFQVNTRWLNTSKRVLPSHSRGSRSQGCCRRLSPRGSPARSAWSPPFPAPPQRGSDSDDLLSQIRNSYFV